MRSHKALDFAIRVGRTTTDERVTLLAASIAFYAVLSIFPSLLLIVVVGSMIGGEAFAETVLSAVQGLLTPESESVLEEALLSSAGRGSAGVIGLIALIWSVLKVFRALDTAFSLIYGTGGDLSFLRTVAHAIIVAGMMGIAFLAMFVVSTVVRYAPLSPAVGLFSPILVFLTFIVLFTPIYVVFPGVSQRLIRVLPGAVFAAAGWTLLGQLFGLYAAAATTYALFGVIGGMLLLLTWFYFGAIFLLVGAVINAILADRPHLKPDGPLGTEERAIGAPHDGQRVRDE